MKILIAPVHHFIGNKAAPQNSRMFGSEYARAYDYLFRISKEKDVFGDAIVGYSDVTSMGNIKIHSLYKKPLSYVSSIARLLFPFRVFLKSILLMSRNKYDCLWHLGPFGFNKTFSILAILNPQQSRVIIGPVYTPLNIEQGLHGNEKVSIKQKIDGFLYDKFSNVFKYLSLTTLKKAHKVILVENAGLAILKSLGLNTGTVLHLAMSDNNFKSKPRPLKSKTINLIYVGYLVDRKRVEDVVMAVNYLVKHGTKNVLLTIAGDGPMKTQIMSLINKNNINKYVSLLGKVSRDKVFNLYKKADIFVTGSVLESMPNMYFEAMSSALPMVIAENSSASELKNDDFGGFVVSGKKPDEIANALAKIISDPKLYQQMSLKNYKLSNTTYDFEKEMEKLIAILKEK